MCKVLRLLAVLPLWLLSCLSKCLTKQKLCLLFKILAVWVLTILCLLLISNDLPYSKLYDWFGTANHGFKTIKRINNERRQLAHDYLSQINANKTRARYLQNANSENLRYAIGVVSVARESHWVQLEYLTQVMARLDHILVKNGAADSVFPFICNTDAHPEYFKEATQLSNFFPNITRVYSQVFTPETRTRNSKQENEKQDYVFCLEAAMRYNADYVILLQDDAYPSDNFYEVLEHIVKSKLETRILRGELVPVDDERWAWVKLTFPYNHADYHKNWYFFCQWIALSLFLAGTCCLLWHIYAICVPTCSLQLPTMPYCSATKVNQIQPTICALLLSAVYIYLVLGIIGRPYYLELRSISPYTYALDPGTSCCIVAVLYRPAEISGIVNYLRGLTCSAPYPLDFALDDYRDTSNVKQYLLSPNIFSHIGFYSALHNQFSHNKLEFIQ